MDSVYVASEFMLLELRPHLQHTSQNVVYQ